MSLNKEALVIFIPRITEMFSGLKNLAGWDKSYTESMDCSGVSGTHVFVLRQSYHIFDNLPHQYIALMSELHFSSEIQVKEWLRFQHRQYNLNPLFPRNLNQKKKIIKERRKDFFSHWFVKVIKFFYSGREGQEESQKKYKTYKKIQNVYFFHLPSLTGVWKIGHDFEHETAGVFCPSQLDQIET